MTSLLDAALARLNENLFFIHPLHDTANGDCSCGGKAVNPDCSAGKHPRLTGYQDEATDDPRVIERHWSRFPHANVGGIVLDGRGVLDVDPRHGGDLALTALEKQHESLPATVKVETAGGGWHFYFKLPPGFTPKSQKVSLAGLGIELLFPGSNVVLPGSVVHGKTYSYTPGKSPQEVEVAELPRWILDLLNDPSPPPTSTRTHARSSVNTRSKLNIPSSIPGGTRHIRLSSIAGTLINYGIRDEALAAELNEIDRTRCRPPLGPKEVERISTSMQKTHDGKPQTDAWKIKNRTSILNVLNNALSTTWSGKTGNSEFSILFALLAVAHESGDLTIEVSYRQIAELGCIALDTVAKRLPGLIDKGWIRIHATYRQRIAYLLSNKAKPEELANAKTVFDIIPVPQKQYSNPTPPLLFWLCGIDALRVKGLGIQAIKIINVLMQRSYPSVSQLARAAQMNVDATARKIKRMVKVGWASRTKNEIALIDLSTVDFTEAAKLLKTYGKGERQRQLHRRQQKANREEYWGVKEEEEQQEGQHDGERTVYILYKDDSRAATPSPPIANDMPVPVQVPVDDHFVKLGLGEWDSSIGNGTLRQAASYRPYRRKSGKTMKRKTMSEEVSI